MHSDAATRVTSVPAVLLDMQMQSEGEGAHTRLSFASERRTFEAIALGHEGPWLSMMLTRLTVDTLRLLQLPGQDCPLVAGFTTGTISGFLKHVPEDICPRPGCVERVQALVDEIRTPPLRTFVTHVFADRDVHDRFWTQPASLRHHHAFPGGLAAHSVEVASDLAGHAPLTETERDLGIAGALLHDIGKIWSYDRNSRLTPAAQAMGHELLGLQKVHKALVGLEAEWPDGAYAMHVLLSGHAHRRADGSMPYSLTQRIRACDQRSAERSGVTERWRRQRGWVPAAYGQSATAA